MASKALSNASSEASTSRIKFMIAAERRVPWLLRQAMHETVDVIWDGVVIEVVRTFEKIIESMDGKKAAEEAAMNEDALDESSLSSFRLPPPKVSNSASAPSILRAATAPSLSPPPSPPEGGSSDFAARSTSVKDIETGRLSPSSSSSDADTDMPPSAHRCTLATCGAMTIARLCFGVSLDASTLWPPPWALCWCYSGGRSCSLCERRGHPCNLVHGKRIAAQLRAAGAPDDGLACGGATYQMFDAAMPCAARWCDAVHEWAHHLRRTYTRAKVIVRLVRGRDLLAADHVLRRGPPTSDPYCNITLGDQTRTSKVRKRTLNPDWDETFEFKGQLRWLVNDDAAAHRMLRRGSVLGGRSAG